MLFGQIDLFASTFYSNEVEHLKIEILKLKNNNSFYTQFCLVINMYILQVTNNVLFETTFLPALIFDYSETFEQNG